MVGGGPAGGRWYGSRSTLRLAVLDFLIVARPMSRTNVSNQCLEPMSRTNVSNQCLEPMSRTNAVN
jgi:hypothetical protein